MRNIEDEIEYPLEWRTFSLEQVNLPPDDDPDELWANADRRRSLLPSAAAKWAEAQGPDLLRTVQLAFYEANHVDRKKIGKPEVTEEVLTGAGLDGAAITSEIRSSTKWLDAARADHDAALDLGIFGVPTLVFPDGSQPIFVRLVEITEGDQAMDIYRRVHEAAADPVIHEFKKTTGER